MRKGKIYGRFIKRVIGFLVALITSPFILLLTIPIGILIKHEDGGSIFYYDYRYGMNMKKFRMIKYRTMKMNAPDIRNTDGSTYNSANDERLTKIGAKLRVTSIDELPQIFNVLVGDMSFIGPRPSPLGNEKTYTEFVKRKFRVRPGMTGYNQALLRNNASLEERYQNDVYYAEHVSFLFDLRILKMTIATVFKRENVYKS